VARLETFCFLGEMMNCLPEKYIMSGRVFHQWLCYLHMCDLSQQIPHGKEVYNLMYKVKELIDALVYFFNLPFLPGQVLSLDETLIHALESINFKIHIISKADR